MKEGFRQCMAWLHTWTGLVVGWILFFVFLTGTAGYIQLELTRWMQPELPLRAQVIPSQQEQFNQANQFLSHSPDALEAVRWRVDFLSKDRGSEQLQVSWSMPTPEGKRFGPTETRYLDPVTGQATAQVEPRDTAGGRTLYRMHYALHYIPYDIAIRIVGVCTMLMFAAIITGVITHKKIFKDFFTFRPAKGQRSWLDVHNVLSVIALPFYIMITYSGLIFFLNAYMPYTVPIVYGQSEEDQDRYFNELYKESFSRGGSARGEQHNMQYSMRYAVDVAPLLAQAQQQWGTSGVSSLNIYAAQGENPARVEFYKNESDSVQRKRTAMHFDLSTGKKISDNTINTDPGALVFGRSLLGLHEGSFASPVVRWLYVLSGLLGTAMIATGLVLWTVKRRPKQIKAGKMSFGHNLVEHLNIAMIAGLPLAIAVYFWANRLISATWADRAAWEVHSLYMTLALCLIYAYCRPIARAWFELLCLAAAAYLLLPVLNAFTTERHLLATVLHGDYALASVDFGFILFGSLLAWAAYAVWRKRNAILKAPVKKKAKTASNVKTDEPQSKQQGESS